MNSRFLLVAFVISLCFSGSLCMTRAQIAQRASARTDAARIVEVSAGNRANRAVFNVVNTARVGNTVDPAVSQEADNAVKAHEIVGSLLQANREILKNLYLTAPSMGGNTNRAFYVMFGTLATDFSTMATNFRQRAANSQSTDDQTVFVRYNIL
jgi:hypothetical protein